jgi:hypothetical protein
MMSALLASTISCRSIKRNKVQADSTVTRSEQISQTWTSETVTEISLPAGELAAYLEADSSTQLPQIVSKPAPERKSVFARLGFKSKKIKKPAKTLPSVTVPALISADGRVNIKKTQRESGSIDSRKLEQKQVQTLQKDKATKPNPASWLTGISLAAITLLVCLIINHRSKQR